MSIFMSSKNKAPSAVPMGMQTEVASENSMIVDYVRLPDKLEAGAYNVYGDNVGPQPTAGDDPNESTVRVIIELSPPAPIYHIWGVFGVDLKPGQEGAMNFLNLPGDLPVAGAFTEWSRDRNVPVISDDTLLVRTSVQRAAGLVRIIGRNDSDRSVSIAAGVVVGTLALASGT
jgi:hypothetical protein